MKVLSILGGSGFLSLLSAWAVGAIRPGRTGHDRRAAASTAEKSRALTTKSMKGCSPRARGKGKKAVQCPVPRRLPPPTRRPTTAPSAPPSTDVCLAYTKDPTGLSSHLYGIANADLGFTWVEAQAAVQEMKSCCGGIRPHLVSITSKAENDLVLSLFAGNVLASGNSAFLGLTNRNQASDATFVWDGTSESFNYESWCTPANGNCLTTEPDNGPNACAAMLLLDLDVTPGVWADYDCDLTAPTFFVFEYDCPSGHML
jgi:Lectin C-type domain